MTTTKTHSLLGSMDHYYFKTHTSLTNWPTSIGKESLRESSMRREQVKFLYNIIRRTRLFRSHCRRDEILQGQIPRLGGEEDSRVRSFLHCGRRERLGRLGKRPTWICRQVLHRRGQLRHDWKQHSRLLHQRPLKIPRFHPHLKEESSNQPQGR